MKNKSLKIILIVLASLVVIGIIAGAIFSFVHRPYMAVYLATGDIYFGRVSSFPQVTIQDPWFFRRAEDGSVSLERFSDAVWMPEDVIKINRDQIVFMARISENSQIIAMMEGRIDPQQQQPQQPQQQQQQQQPPQQQQQQLQPQPQGGIMVPDAEMNEPIRQLN